MDEVICNISLLMKYWSIIFLEVHHRIPVEGSSWLGATKSDIGVRRSLAPAARQQPGIQISAGGGTATSSQGLHTFE